MLSGGGYAEILGFLDEGFGFNFVPCFTLRFGVVFSPCLTFERGFDGEFCAAFEAVTIFTSGLDSGVHITDADGFRFDTERDILSRALRGFVRVLLGDSTVGLGTESTVGTGCSE